MSLSRTVMVARLGAPDAAYNIGITNGRTHVSLSMDRMEDGMGLHVALSADDAEDFGRALIHAAENVRSGIHGSEDPSNG